MTGTRFPDYLTWSMFSNGVAYCVNAAEANLASVSGRASLDWATCHGSCFFSFRSAVNVFTPKRERNSPEHSSLQAAININLDALVHDLHESGVVLLADNEWVRISGLSCSKGRQLAGKSIHDRMVLQFNVDLHLLGPLLEVIERMQEDPHLVRRSLREHPSADDSDRVALSTVLYGKNESE